MPPRNHQDVQDWGRYKASSPFWPYKMWAFSLPHDGTASAACVGTSNINALAGLVAKSESVGQSIPNPLIQKHINDTVVFWNSVMLAVPTLRQQALAIDGKVEQAAGNGFRDGFNNSDGDLIEKGHLGGIQGLSAALANLGPMMRLYRPHVARFGPEALRLARNEQHLDRMFSYNHPSNEALAINIRDLERALAELNR